MTWLKQLLSESGAARFSRTGTFVALVFACGWVSYLAWQIGSLPSLDRLALFLGSLYGLGKVGETFQRVLGNKP
jgi:hypothetical protein